MIISFLITLGLLLLVYFVGYKHGKELERKEQSQSKLKAYNKGWQNGSDHTRKVCASQYLFNIKPIK